MQGLPGMIYIYIQHIVSDVCFLLFNIPPAYTACIINEKQYLYYNLIIIFYLHIHLRVFMQILASKGIIP